MQILKPLGGPDGVIPRTEPRMEPPVVCAVAARFGQHFAVQAPENRMSHEVDAIAAQHALGTVEVDLVELAGVEDARDVFRQIGGQRRVRPGIEGEVALLQIGGAVADRMLLRPGLESATPALRKGVGRIRNNGAVLHDLRADAHGIAVARVAEDHIVMG